MKRKPGRPKTGPECPECKATMKAVIKDKSYVCDGCGHVVIARSRTQWETSEKD